MKKKHYELFGEQYFGAIAHRGLHNDEFTENGLKAFENAINHNLAFELDIHLTKDKKLVVCHDSELKRTTGKEGIIENLTFDEIRNNYRLLDGEVVPSFQEVLDLNQERCLIVVELKTYNKNHKELAKAANECLKQIKNKKSIVIISFDPRALIRAKGFARGLLVGSGDFWVWRLRYLFESVDIGWDLLERKTVQKYYKKHYVNVWTIETTDLAKKVVPYADAITFQHCDYQEIENLLKNKNN